MTEPDIWLATAGDLAAKLTCRNDAYNVAQERIAAALRVAYQRGREEGVAEAEREIAKAKKSEEAVQAAVWNGQANSPQDAWPWWSDG